MITPSGPRIMLPGSYVNELRNNKDLTLTGVFKSDFFPNYKGFEAFKSVIGSTLLIDTVRTKLTQSLGKHITAKAKDSS
jgi:hypothetical protein